MTVPADPDPLLLALDELAALAAADDQARLADGRARLAAQRLRVLVAGEAKRGKSTLVNALLGRPLLPTGVTPLTALATTVRHGTGEHVLARYRDGRQERGALADLGDLVTERGNPGNRRALASVTVVVDAPVLARGAELVDTPGTGSVHAHNTAEAQTALDTMDAAVFVLTADPPVSASERDLLTRVTGRSVRTFVVLNKADYLAGYGDRPDNPDNPDSLDSPGSLAPPGSELAEAVAFTAQVTGQAAGAPVRVYPLSARAALGAGGDPGFAEFRRDFLAYLDRGRHAGLRRSLAAQARRVAGALRDEAALTRQATRLRSGAAADRVDAFAARLAAVTERRQYAAGLVQGESARLLAALNDAAAAESADCAARIGAALEELLAGELQAAPAAEIERAGRAALVTIAVQAAEAWRQQQAQRLEQGLARLGEQLAAQLQAELDQVRGAAADLLGLQLTVPAPAGHLQPDLRFFYPVAEEAGQTELLAGTIRRHLPGEAGRRRARGYLRREAAGLIPRQIGRARADLQYRLAEAARRLARSAGASYTGSTGRLAEALAAAETASGLSAGQAARRDGELADRMAVLDRVLGRLGEAEAAGTVRPAAAPAGPGPG